MGQQSKTTLKTYFNTGDTPTEAQFVDLIDSFQDASAVLAATTASFTTANETKLAAIEALADVTDATNVAAAGAVMNSGNSTIAGVKTFTSSPIVPAPTTDLQVATKKYVDDAVTASGGYTDEAAQDAVGGILNPDYFDYNDATPDIKLATLVLTSLALADTALQPADIGVSVQAYSAVLAATTASFTSADETKLDGIETGAEVNTVTPTNTATLTNKRITMRVQAVASAATVTPSWDNDDCVTITAQAAALELANPTGTPTSMQPITIRIKDDGTARAITYGTQYRGIGVTLPTTTVISKTLYLGGMWNAADSKFDIIGYALEA